MERINLKKVHENTNIIPIIIGTLAIISYYFNSESSIVFLFEIFSLLIINLYFILLTKKENNIIQPITIINLLTIIMFCVRPIFVFLSDFDSIKNMSSAFRFYSFINQTNSFMSLPNGKAILIILIGSFTLNFSYFNFTKVEIVKPKIFDYSKTKLSRDGTVLMLIITIVSAALFFLKYDYNYLLLNAGKLSVIGVDFDFYELLWLYFFPFVIGYFYMNSLSKNKKPIFAIILFLVEIILLRALSRRSFAINIFIILFLISYFQKDRPKIKLRKILPLVAIAAAVVLGYASIRDANIGKETSNSVLVETINEFDMYDMFVTSIDYYSNHTNNYNGLSYLSFPFIPNVIWKSKPQYFDILNSSIVLGGYYLAGIPTSIYGSSYLNFGIIGMIIAMCLIGFIFRKIYLKLFPLKNIKSLFYYSVFLIFVYDFFRVGDFAREIWSFLLYFVCMIICNSLIYKGEETNEH